MIKTKRVRRTRSQIRINEINKTLISKQWAIDLLDQDPLFFDTETTGLGNRDQVIEIAVIDRYGFVVLNTRIKPTVPIHPDAQCVHEISLESLDNAPVWSEVAQKINDAFLGREIVAFNAKFDIRLLHQTHRSTYPQNETAPPIGWYRKENVTCAMNQIAWSLGSEQGRISLVMASDLFGVDDPDHSALGDSMTTLKVIMAIAKEGEDLLAELAVLEALDSVKRERKLRKLFEQLKTDISSQLESRA